MRSKVLHELRLITDQKDGLDICGIIGFTGSKIGLIFKYLKCY